MPEITYGEQTTKPARKRGDDRSFIKQVRENIQNSWEHDQDNRREASTDLSFLAGNQWPDSVRRERTSAGRPMLTINRLPQFVRQITNDIRQADLAIKVVPEDDNDDVQLAQVFDGLIRQIQYRSSAQHVFSTAAEHQASCGIGWFRIASQYVDDDVFDQELRIKIIPNPLSVYCDPGAIEPDRSDAHWIAVTEMLPRATFKRRYPKAMEVEIDAPVDTGSSPMFWSTQDSIRIAEYWCKKPVKRTIALVQLSPTEHDVIDITEFKREQIAFLPPIVRTREVDTHKIEMSIVSGAEILEGPFEWQGKHIPIVPVIGGEFPLEDKRYRYGAIRFARDPQQLYNYWRTATAESIALAPKAPYVGTAKQIGPYKAMWDTAHTANRPYLLYAPDSEAPGAPKREHPPEVPAALISEAQVASDDMKGTTGIYDAALGNRSNETAGIAIRRRQAESDVANYHFVDNLQRSIEYAGRILVDLIPRVYDNERVVRLLGDDGQEQPTRINQVIMNVDGTPLMVNDLSQAAFDVRVTIGRGYATKRAETADAMLEFMKAMPAAGPVLADLIAKALDFPDSDVIATRLKKIAQQQGMLEPDEDTPPPPDPLANPIARTELENKHADTRKKMAEARKLEIETAVMLNPPILTPEPPVPPAESFALPQQPPMPPGGVPPEMMGAGPMPPPPEIGGQLPPDTGPTGPVPPDMGERMPPA